MQKLHLVYFFISFSRLWCIYSVSSVPLPKIKLQLVLQTHGSTVLAELVEVVCMNIPISLNAVAWDLASWNQRSRFHNSWWTHIFNCFWGSRHLFTLLLRSSSFLSCIFFWCSFVALFKADLLNLSSSSGSPSSLTSSFSSSTSSESSAGSISSATSKVPRQTLHMLSLCFSMPNSKVVFQQLSDEFFKKTLYSRLSLTNLTARSYYLIFKG